jgi:hypothetical protein
MGLQTVQPRIRRGGTVSRKESKYTPRGLQQADQPPWEVSTPEEAQAGPPIAALSGTSPVTSMGSSDPIDRAVEREDEATYRRLDNGSTASTPVRK